MPASRGNAPDSELFRKFSSDIDVIETKLAGIVPLIPVDAKSKWYSWRARPIESVKPPFMVFPAKSLKKGADD